MQTSRMTIILERGHSLLQSEGENVKRLNKLRSVDIVNVPMDRSVINRVLHFILIYKSQKKKSLG